MSSEARRLVEEAPVFACLTPEARAFIVERLEPMTLAGGDVLIHQGDAADALFIVAMGRFRVSMTATTGVASCSLNAVGARSSGRWRSSRTSPGRRR